MLEVFLITLCGIYINVIVGGCIALFLLDKKYLITMLLCILATIVAIVTGVLVYLVLTLL